MHLKASEENVRTRPAGGLRCQGGRTKKPKGVGIIAGQEDLVTLADNYHHFVMLLPPA